jgi:hypothetical protein
MATLLLLTFAFVFCCIAAARLAQPAPYTWRSVNFGWLGVALYILVALLGAAGVR